MQRQQLPCTTTCTSAVLRTSCTLHLDILMEKMVKGTPVQEHGELMMNLPACNLCHGQVVIGMYQQRLFILCTRDRKLCTVIVYDVYIMYWAFDEYLKPCRCNGYSRSHAKKNTCTAVLRILGRRFTHVSTFLHAT